MEPAPTAFLHLAAEVVLEGGEAEDMVADEAQPRLEAVEAMAADEEQPFLAAGEVMAADEAQPPSSAEPDAEEAEAEAYSKGGGVQTVLQSQ